MYVERIQMNRVLRHNKAIWTIDATELTKNIMLKYTNINSFESLSITARIREHLYRINTLTK